jgi:hypothetical protein
MSTSRECHKRWSTGLPPALGYQMQGYAVACPISKKEAKDE